MKPWQTFVFGISFIACISLISICFPVDGMTVMGKTFFLPNPSRWFSEDTLRFSEQDLNKIVALVDTTDNVEEVVIAAPADTTATEVNKDSVVLDLEKLYAGIEPFQFPADDPNVLNNFFEAAQNSEGRTKPIRILHYGDSQIEGDRITSTIRNYMQKTYGGEGSGLVPVVPVAAIARTFQGDVDAAWKRYSMLDKNAKNNVANWRYGLSGNLARFEASDSSAVAHIGFTPYYAGYQKARTFSRLTVLCGNAAQSYSVKLNNANERTGKAAKILNAPSWDFSQAQSSFKLDFTGDSLPDVYGVLMDGKSGVAVDNLGLRGVAGVEVSHMNAELVKQMLAVMDVRMIILQFGGNVAPGNQPNYDFYYKTFSAQIKRLKSLKNDLAIIVIGVNDICQNTPNGYVSYPSVPMVRDAQKRAALENGCVFWDLLNAMGGLNSMPSWVFAEKPLAQKDFLHFTPAGAKVVAELFCKAWAKEYQKYLNGIN